MSFQELLGSTRVVPVITIRDADTAVPLAEALLAGGLQVLEVTLRTDAGLESIRRIAADVPDAVIGAGTVTTPQQLLDARNAGARFIVSPGATDSLARAAADAGGVFLPGAVTASEVLALLERGIAMMKFFPAESSGGEGAGRTVSTGELLPDRRYWPGDGAGLSGAAQRRLHRRLVDGARRPDRAARVACDHGTRRRGDRGHAPPGRRSRLRTGMGPHAVVCGR